MGQIHAGFGIELADHMFHSRHETRRGGHGVHTHAQQQGQAAGVRGQFAADRNADALAVGRVNDPLERAHHRRMQRFVQIAHMAIVAVNGHQVMDQVVGADAEKVALAGQGVAHHHGGRGFHHDAQRQVRRVGKVLGLQFLAQFLQNAAHALHFGQTGNHGQQQRQIARHPGPQQRPQLSAENALMA